MLNAGAHRPMWTEQWSAKKQKPFFLDVVSGRRTWEHPVPTVAESYDSVAETQDDGVKPRALQEVRFFHNQVNRFCPSCGHGRKTSASSTGRVLRKGW